MGQTWATSTTRLTQLKATSMKPWSSISPPSLHARSRTTTPTPRPFNLPCKQERTTLTTSSPLSLKPKRTHQPPEPPDQDARRPCQTEPSVPPEERPHAMKDSAAVPPESHKVTS